MAQSPETADVWQWLSLFSPMAALLANIIAQVLLFRFRKGARFLRSIVEGVVVGIVAGLLWKMLLLPLREPSAGQPHFTIENIVTYLALSYCYYNFAQLGLTSIRVRIYEELSASAEGLSEKVLTEKYDETALLRLRLQRLLESGDLIENNGRYIVGRSRLVLTATVLFAAKKFMLGRVSEFD